MPRRDPKIYAVGPMLIGFTSSFRMGQLLGYSLSVPAQLEDVSTEKFMASVFVDAVRQCMKAGGYTKTEHGVESGGRFLTAYRGRIFEVCDDFQVAEARVPYAAIGCGFELALGSLYTSGKLDDPKGLIDPRDRVHAALEAAEMFSAAVRRPFQVQVLR